MHIIEKHKNGASINVKSRKAEQIVWAWRNFNYMLDNKEEMDKIKHPIGFALQGEKDELS